MRNIILFLAIILFFISCSSDKVITQQNEKEYDLSTYLHKLDSVGVDIKNDTLLFAVGNQNLYYGKNERGNALINYALSKRDSITDEDYHDWSVQNTKNGNYAIAIDKLEKAMELNPQKISRYYGWVLLYYYHDYKKALAILEQYDAYTPNFSDAPMGEDIHYLKGLCQMQMQYYQEAVDEFDIYINNLATTHGEDFVDVYTFVQKGRCLTYLGKFDEAINSYKKAIQYYEKCTEAYYFMGLTQLEMNKKDSACNNFNTALGMIKKGYKSSDTYVEYFHEIYPQQIEKSIKESCK
jgi:tetratricopeptide (TPR) repeat protein